MIGQVQIVNGQKQIVPLSGGVPDGSVGSLIMKYKKIQPKNCLYCDGRDTTGTDEELRIYYPALYMYLGSNVLPDYRECTFVGAEQNTTDTIATHDVYSQGQFKDDQMQRITGTSEYMWNNKVGIFGLTTSGSLYKHDYSPSGRLLAEDTYWGSGTTGAGGIGIDSSLQTRTGNPDVTHGKQKAVYVYIVAVDSVVVSDDESFLRVVENYVDTSLANALSTSVGDLTATNEIITYSTWGKMVQLHITYTGTITVGGSYNFTTRLPENLRPSILYRGFLINNNIDEPCGQCVINQSGYINMWVSQLESTSMANLQCSCTFITS